MRDFIFKNLQTFRYQKLERTAENIKRKLGIVEQFMGHLAAAAEEKYSKPVQYQTLAKELMDDFAGLYGAIAGTDTDFDYFIKNSHMV